MSNKRRTIEIFTAGCQVCEEAVRKVKGLACKDCEIIVYNLNEPCDSGECLEKVKTYNITRIPAVFVDGNIADCCRVGPVNLEGLKAAGVGEPY